MTAAAFSNIIYMLRMFKFIFMKLRISFSARLGIDRAYSFPPQTPLHMRAACFTAMVVEWLLSRT